jgi:hypothetical protein
MAVLLVDCQRQIGLSSRPRHAVACLGALWYMGLSIQPSVRRVLGNGINVPLLNFIEDSSPPVAEWGRCVVNVVWCRELEDLEHTLDREEGLLRHSDPKSFTKWPNVFTSDSNVSLLATIAENGKRCAEHWGSPSATLWLSLTKALKVDRVRSARAASLSLDAVDVDDMLWEGRTFDATQTSSRATSNVALKTNQDFRRLLQEARFLVLVELVTTLLDSPFYSQMPQELLVKHTLKLDTRTRNAQLLSLFIKTVHDVVLRKPKRPRSSTPFHLLVIEGLLPSLTLVDDPLLEEAKNAVGLYKGICGPGNRKVTEVLDRLTLREETKLARLKGEED